MVVYGENDFLAAGGFFAAIPQVATGKIGWKAEQQSPIQFLLYIHGADPLLKRPPCCNAMFLQVLPP